VPDVNSAELPLVRVTPLSLVIAGAWSTVSVNVCVAVVPLPLDALMHSEKL
jgi:hypothetical protein